MTTRDKIISQEVLKDLLSYDSNTGVLIWRNRPEKYFTSQAACKRWNSRYAGNIAGGGDKRGGITLKIFDKSVSAPRVIYLLLYGYIPKGKVTYLSNDKSNLKLDNFYFK